MRILTPSIDNSHALISLMEAESDAPQNIIFCVPIDKFESKRINTLQDFHLYFGSGISTKIREEGRNRTIKLEYSNTSGLTIPRFTASIRGFQIDFYLSQLNFINNDKNNDFSFDFFYNGNKFRDLIEKKFIILECNWKQLDRLFIESKILFTDWE